MMASQKVSGFFDYSVSSFRRTPESCDIKELPDARVCRRDGKLRHSGERRNPDILQFQQRMNRRGFTLLELIISLMVTVMVAAIVFTALRLSSRAWAAGEERADRLRRTRIVLDLMTRQFRSVHREPVPAVDTPPAPVPLTGQTDAVQWATRLSIVPDHRQTPVFVQYRIERDPSGASRLMFRESETPFSEESGLTEEDYREILSGVYSMGFSFLTETGDWREDFFPETNTPFPRAVGITLRLHPEDAPLRVIAALQR
jgi:prepilin-type N-terminal cleavage/methylation domain-containing protein